MRRPAWTAAAAVLLSLSLASAAQAAVVVSEVRFRGPAGANDEFVEIRNTGTSGVAIGGYRLQGCAAASGALSTRATVPANVELGAGRAYLFANAATGGYSSATTPDQTYTTGFSDTAGSASGAVIAGGTGTVLDGIGLPASPCREGTGREFPTTNADTSFERATDTGDNAVDFTMRNPSAPENLASPPRDGEPEENAAPAIDCPSTISEPQAPGSVTRSITAFDADGTITAIALVSDGGTGTTVGATTAETAEAPARATLTVPTDTARSGSVVLRAANEDTAPQTVECAINVTVKAPTPISAVQGAGTASPLVGNDVTIEGVVTGIDDEVGASFGSGNSIRTFAQDAGIYVQTDGAGDGDPATSEGVFVGFVGAAAADGDRAAFLGKRVRVTGRVTEQFGQTQINESFGQEPTILGDAPALPAAIVIDPAEAAAQVVSPAGSVMGTRSYYERLEGMRVQLAAGTANSGGTNKFGELFLTPGATQDRVFRTEVQPDLISVDADAGAGDPANPYLAPQSTTYVRADLFDTVSNSVGPLGFSFGNYKVTPQEGAEPIVADTGVAFPNESVAPQAANTLRVTAFNVENFFPVGGQLDGGTVSQEEFAARRDQIVDAIDRLLKRPDVVGVEEVADLQSLQAVASRLGGYTAYLEEGNDSRGIDVGFLIKDTVRATNVRQLGKAARNPTSAGCSDVPGGLFDRPPLAADIAGKNGKGFTVLVNHFSSKAAPDACRAAQAEFNRDRVAEIEAAGGEAIVMGDLNAFEDESALTTLEGPETTLDNLWDMAPAEERYSFAFQGKLQTLDHILVTEGLTPKAFQYAHFDNDYYDRDSPTDGHKTSDHDPPLVTLEGVKAIKDGSGRG